MGKCIKCKNYEKEIQGCLYMDADCKNGEKFEPITNYDRIKSMSVEEMAMFLVKCDGDMQGTTKEEKEDEARDIQQWLLQEVSEDDR